MQQGTLDRQDKLVRRDKQDQLVLPAQQDRLDKLEQLDNKGQLEQQVPQVLREMLDRQVQQE